MKRRQFFIHVATTIFLSSNTNVMSQMADESDEQFKQISLFLCGDVMTGRGIDQVLPHPSDPRLYKPYVRDSMVYVKFAEQVNGP